MYSFHIREHTKYKKSHKTNAVSWTDIREEQQLVLKILKRCKQTVLTRSQDHRSGTRHITSLLITEGNREPWLALYASCLGKSL